MSSLHIHLDIAHNSSSYSLIIIICSLSRSTGSFPINIARRMLATILNKGEQRSLEKDECMKIIRSGGPGGPLPTIQVKSSGSLPNALPSNTDIAQHDNGTNTGPAHARYNQCLNSQGDRVPVHRVKGERIWSFCAIAPSPAFI